MTTLPYPPEEPFEVSSLEDGVQQWVDEHDSEGDDVFKMSDFDFMPIRTKFVEDKIRDTPTGEPQQEEWKKMSPES